MTENRPTLSQSGLVEANPDFAAVPASETIRSGMARMWLVSALGKGGAQLVQLAALVFLARLLVPADFGLIAMVMAIVGVADIFRDLGLSASTVKAKEISPAQVSTLFAINVCFGALMSVLVYVLAPFIAAFYDDSRILQVAQAIAWTFLIGSMGSQHLALLRRQLKFALLARINLVSVIVGQSLAVALAFWGAGYWALIAATLATQVARVVMAWVLSDWRPGVPTLDSNVRQMLSFGGYLVVFSLLGYLAFNIQNIVIGWRFDAAEVGYYGRAFAIIALLLGYVMGPLELVAPAALSRMIDEPGRYNETYLHSVAMMLLLSAPIGFFTTVAAGDIVATLLGDSWHNSVRVLQILALAAVPQTLCGSSGWLYMSNGDSRSMMQWGVFGWSALIVLICLGTLYGIIGVAAGYTVGMWVLLYPCMRMAFRRTSLRFSQLLSIAVPIALPALLAVLPVWWLQAELQGLPPLGRLLIVGLCYAAMYLLVLVYVFRQGGLLADVKRQLFYGRGAVA